MSIKSTKQMYKLNGEAIDTISFDIMSLLKELKIEKKSALGIRLSMEEILLKWRDELGEETDIEYSSGSRFGKPYISLTIKGDECNPFEISGEDFNGWSNDFLANLGLSPNYVYKNNRNIVTLSLNKPQKNPLIIYMLSVLLAVGVGFAGLLIPESIKAVIIEQGMTPIYNAFLGLFKTVAVPMVFLGVVGGIYAMGDANVFGRVGKRMMGRFLGVSFCITALTGIVLTLVFNLNFSQHGAEISLFHSVFNVFLDFIPEGFFNPFVEGKALQVIVIAVVIGFSLLVLGDKGKYVAKNIEELNYIGIFADGLLAKIIPLFVFITIVQNMWTNNIKDFARAWKPVLVFVVCVFTFIGISIAAVCIKTRVSPAVLIKKLFPTFFIAITSASTSAVFGEYVSTIGKELGVNDKMTGFGSVLGLVFFSPSTAINYVVCAYYVAELNNVDCSLSWIIVAVIISFILSIATPTIPGGAIPIYSALFLQLGLPASALAVIITIDVIFDFISTALDKNFAQLELVLQANKNGYLDRDILKK